MMILSSTALFLLAGLSAAAPRPDTNISKRDSIWKPSVGVSWNYQLRTPITLPSTINTAIKVWGIDLVDNSAATISIMHDRGVEVICYFSAGSYEEWRPDASSFQGADLGNNLHGWPGERWLDVRSQNVRKIMKARLDLAVKKGCDAVDPDNVDGYINDNGLGLSKSDAIDYVRFLAKEAHGRNLAMSLKNAGEIIPDVIDQVDFSVNEQCLEHGECNTFGDFIGKDKPVFHVEYPKGDVSNNDAVDQATKDHICDDETASRFSTVIKNVNLDQWIQRC